MTDAITRLNDALRDRYRIERELGQGGMATVYLAEDVRHDRKVAIKVLKPELAAVVGADRFLAEIKTTANLQHPHILPLHDSGEAGSFLFYVMPFIEGESLRERLDRERQLPMDEARRLARAVAGALDHAHRQGVVHRDIKPANILLQDGEPVVADFGIALAVAQAGGDRVTETGLSLGTPHYMSPEQATGEREIDARADVYALGCVLYEMLAGEPPFTGRSAQAVLAKILTAEAPALSSMRPSIAPHVEAAVHRALSRLPADRFRSASDFSRALDVGEAAAPMSGGVRAANGRGIGGSPFRRALPWAVAAVATGLALWSLLHPGTPGVEGRRSRFLLDITTVNSTGRRLALSADRSLLAYIGTGPAERFLFVRRLDELSSSPLRGTELGQFPFFSEDGDWVGFTDGAQLLKTRVSGGLPIAIVGDLGDVRGADWEAESIIYSASGSFWRIHEDGGDPQLLLEPDSAAGELGLRWPSFIPGGEAVVYTVWKGAVETAEFGVLLTRTGERKHLGAGTDARYSETGHIVFGRSGQALLALPFDAEKLEATGPESVVLNGVLVKAGGAVEYELSQDGSLVYVPAASVNGELTEVAVGDSMRLLSGRRGEFTSPRYSPGGDKVAVALRGEDGRRQVWVYDFTLGTLNPITGGRDHVAPMWMPNGDEVLVAGARPNAAGAELLVLTAAGGGTGAPIGNLFPVELSDESTASVMPDGRSIVFRPPPDSDLGSGVWTFPLDGDAPPAPLVDGPANERAPSISRDGSLLAYVSNESGRDEIWVTDFPDPGRRIQVSRQGGDHPRWSRDGKLFYRQGNVIVETELDTRDGVSVLQSRPVQQIEAGPGASWDVHPSGERFVVVREAEQSGIVVALNWLGPPRS